MTIKIACYGDVVARAGRAGLRKELQAAKAEFQPDVIVVNGENAAGGVGFDDESAREILSYGADVITLGDHAFHKRESRELLARRAAQCVRPANFPAGAPGSGYTVVKTEHGFKVGVFNLLGRVFFNTALDCPFRTADTLLGGPLRECDAIICDMHAEATSEKMAMGHYLDGRVSLVFGTHTHVQTADETILEGGTAYLTDVGMCGPRESVIGMDREVALERLTSGLPSSYKPAKGDAVIGGVVVEVDPQARRTLSITRINRVVKL